MHKTNNLLHKKFTIFYNTKIKFSKRTTPNLPPKLKFSPNNVLHSNQNNSNFRIKKKRKGNSFHLLIHHRSQFQSHQNKNDALESTTLIPSKTLGTNPHYCGIKLHCSVGGWSECRFSAHQTRRARTMSIKNPRNQSTLLQNRTRMLRSIWMLVFLAPKTMGSKSTPPIPSKTLGTNPITAESNFVARQTIDLNVWSRSHQKIF